MTGLIESCWRMIEFLMPTDTKIFRERWPSRLMATAAEGRLTACTGSCSQIKQGCAGCCPDCKQNQNCPCGRASSRHKPWSRFAFGLLFARFAWFERSIPFRCLSNAIICDLRKRTSSIRRSSLISITLGLLTVIGGYLSFASLEEAAGQCLECPLEPCIRARRYGAGRPVLSLRWRLGPARFGSYGTLWGCGGCFRIYRPCTVRRFRPRKL